MVVYEVSVAVAPDAHNEYLPWLRDRVRQAIALDGFAAALWYRPEATELRKDGRIPLVVHYLVRSRRDLERYLRDHEPKMQAEMEERFGGRVSASGRVLHRMEAFEAG